LLLQCFDAGLSWGGLCDSATEGQGSDLRQQDGAARETKRGNWERQGNASVWVKGELRQITIKRGNSTKDSAKHELLEDGKARLKLQ